MARLLATGLAYRAIANHLCMSTQSVRMLAKDPSVVELTAEYSAEFCDAVAPAADETIRLLTGIRHKALRQAYETLEAAEETGTPLPLNRLVQLVELSADRTGYAKRTEVIHRDGDFAAKLALARQRSAKVIELRPAESSMPMSGPPDAGGATVAYDEPPADSSVAYDRSGPSLLGLAASASGELRPLGVEGEREGLSASPSPQTFRRRRA